MSEKECGCGSEECVGLFIDGNDMRVQKCDLCNIFKNDKEAANFIQNYLNINHFKIRELATYAGTGGGPKKRN